jgi:hypothetical protein
MAPESFVFNGIDGANGQYLFPATTVDELAEGVLGAPLELDPHVAELEQRRARDEPGYGVAYPASADRLDEAGWAVVTAADAPPDALAALEPLTSVRRAQAGDLYKTFTGDAGVQPGEGKDEWLGRHGMGPGDAEPDKIPYYVLLVGGPEEIPFSFQYELDVHYAVGRIAFDEPRDYARYAQAVAAAEDVAGNQPPALAVFGPENADDPATGLSATDLAGPLGDDVQRTAKCDCRVTPAVGEVATKQRLADLVCGRDVPELLFTASHGIGFPAGDERQRQLQGALLCQDWPGPRGWGKQPLEDGFYFAAGDLIDAERLPRVMFSFACFSAGTPVDDDYGRLGRFGSRKLSPRPFVASLPQRLLAHPSGHALAFIGHVERAWEYSFSTPEAGAQRGPFVSTLASILDGRRVGHALEPFNSRYAGMGASLANILQVYARRRKRPPTRELAAKWIATNDARNYTLIGDPAVRISAART